MARAPAKKGTTKPTKKPATKKPTTKKPAPKKPTPKKPAPKKPAKSTTKKIVKRRPKIDVEEALSVENLLARGRELEDEREERAALERDNPRAVRPPVDARPANPVHWGYSFYLDETLPAEERERLRGWFERFTTIAEKPSSGFYIVGPDTDPEARRAVWDALGSTLEIEQLRAQIPPDDFTARSERLAGVLANPSAIAWSELVMLLSTWDPATLPEALALAEQGLARWPDELRAGSDKWTTRPELRRLARIHHPKDFATGLPGHCTTLRTQQLDDLLTHQHLFRDLRSLELSGKTDIPAAVMRLTELGRLDRLILHQPTYDSGRARCNLHELLAAPHLQNLTALSLYGYTLEKADLDALADCPQPLEHLRLEDARLQPGDAPALARLAARKRLRTLHLKYNDLGPKGAQALFKDPESWRTLRVLEISANEIGDRGVKALVEAALDELRWLNISSNDPAHQLTGAAAWALTGSPHLGNLHTLNLHGHPIGADGVVALLHARGLPGLRELNVAFANASLADIAARCDDAEPVPLTVLNLGNGESSKKRPDLRRATFLRSVRQLGLDSLDGAEYEDVLRCPHLEALEVLVLGGGYSNTKKGFAALIAADPPPSLRYLSMSGWKLTRDQAAKLAASPLGRQLWGLELLTSYTTPDAWYELYRAGLPTVGNTMLDAHAPSEFTIDTTFRDEV